MKWLTRWFLDNPVAANLLMLFVLAAGLLSLSTIRVESFPQIPPSQLLISVAYPGGTPKQVDEGITQRIENAISGVPGIKSVMSESSRDYATIRVKKTTGTDLDKLMENVRNQVEAIVGFPEQAERPRITRDEYGNLASFVIIQGVHDEAVLQQVSTKVLQALKKHSEISQVANLGKRKQQLVIKPDITQLKRYGLTAQMIAQKVSEWSMAYRSGELKTASGNILLRGDGYADNLSKLKALPILVSNSSKITLEQVAAISREYEATDSMVRYEGKPAIALLVSTSAKDNLLDVSAAIEQVLTEVSPSLPQEIQMSQLANMAPYIEDQLQLLTTNAWQGLLIVLVLLGIFLELKLAFWVAMGIPISLAGAMWLMNIPFFNYSINDITLFGMILVLGILVDDAVVVGESIHTARQKYKDPKEAAWIGVSNVATATTFGVLTTIAAFSPMLWIENELAKVLAGFSAVVIFALIFSLIESKFILPTHLNLKRSGPSTNSLQVFFKRIRSVCTSGLDWFSRNIYQPTLQQALTHRLSALMLFSAIMLVAYGGLNKGTIPSVFFPEIPGRYGTLTVTMDQDAAIELTRFNMMKLEQGIESTNRIVKETYQLVDDPIEQSIVSMEGAARLEATVELSRVALETVSSQWFLETWQEQTGEIEGTYAINYTLAEEPAGGTSITVSAPDRDMARQISRRLVEELNKIKGVSNPFDDSQSGNKQLQVTLNDRGIQLGLQQRDMALLVGGAFGQIEVNRLLEGGEEVSLLVQFPEQQRKTIEQLKNTPVQVAEGVYVNLGEISEFSYSREAEVLYRRNRNEVVTVHWRQNRDVISPEAVWQQLQEKAVPDLLAQFPEVKIEAAGEFTEIAEVQSGFKKAMILTLMLIYILLAVPLKSYWQPLIIMSVIPFGFAGAILGHALMGLSVSILSLFGMMAMTGVVINDSLVLMTCFNQLYRNGMPLNQALIEAGKSRMQAIFLTTVTTVFGLLPLLSETSETAQYLKPAAVSLVFGELLATPITLILIPVLLSFGKSFRQKLSIKGKSSNLENEEKNLGFQTST